MIRLFKHYLPRSLLLLGLLEIGLLFVAAEIAWAIRVAQIDSSGGEFSERLPQLIVYSLTVYLVMLGIGAYQLSCFRSARMSAGRLIVAMLCSIVVLSLVLFFFPDVVLWRSIVLYAIVLSFVFIMLTRLIFLKVVGWRRFRQPVLAIGAGRQGARFRELASAQDAGFQIVRHLRLTDAPENISGTGAFAEVGSLPTYCYEHGIDEIVLALDERRGSLPVKPLLEAKLAGIKVSDMSSFLERMTGRVDLASVSPSWLIFSDGFLGSSRSSIVLKRLFDLVASTLLLIIASPFLILAATAIKLTSPGPLFYRQERVGQLGKPFWITKFRSMVIDAEASGTPQWAQKADPRITPIGNILRKTRIDEIPQIFNVLKGDMSFVGPRPERPFFVGELAAAIPFYNERHAVKPGITGWAQLNYPYGANEEDARHKLEYDLYYIKNYSLFLDIVILIQTVRVVVWQDGVR